MKKKVQTSTHYKTFMDEWEIRNNGAFIDLIESCTDMRVMQIMSMEHYLPPITKEMNLFKASVFTETKESGLVILRHVKPNVSNEVIFEKIKTALEVNDKPIVDMDILLRKHVV